MNLHDDNPSAMDRRRFLKAGVQTGAIAFAAASAKASAVSAVGNQISLRGPLPTKAFGRTGHTLPILGHGGSALIQREAKHYGLTPDDIPSTDVRIKMVRHAYDRGVRYFDTARIYQESESIYGAALKDVRGDVFLASKSMEFSADRVRGSLEESLRQLDTDHLDSLQLHGPVIERHGYDGCMPIVEEMLKLKDEGHFRFLGLTGHTRFEEMHKLIGTGHFDTLLIERGYFHKGYNTRHSLTSVEWRDQCLAKAHDLNVAIVAMKVMSANIFGHNAANIYPEFDSEKRAKLPGAAIRYVMADPRVSMLLIGASKPTDIDANIEIMTANTDYTLEDRALLAEFAAKAYENPVVTELNIA